MAQPAPANFPSAFWRTLKRLDKGKINPFGLSIRNALAVMIPLGVAIALGHPLGGVALATGALNVAYSDGTDPYAQRARRMFLWSLLGAFAVFLGSATGNNHFLAILIGAAWAFVAGLLVSISTKAGDLGLNTLVALIVYAARGAMSPSGAFIASLLVLAGGVWQTLIALLAWPLRRTLPQKRAIAAVYATLARQLRENEDLLDDPLKGASSQVQDALSAVGRDHSSDGERFRLLFDQADRLRLSITAIRHLSERLADGTGEHTAKFEIGKLLAVTYRILDCASETLLTGKVHVNQAELSQDLEDFVCRAQEAKRLADSAVSHEVASAIDTLAGQLRLVVKLVTFSTDIGEVRYASKELALPWKLQLRDWLATLRANLTLQSSACRHGIRLAVCVAIGDAIGRSIGVQRNYWLPMTVAVVLKPDFTTTLSRGVLRLFGTFVGLLVATALFHLLPQTAFVEALLVGVFTFLLRYLGPGNYGIFSLTIASLIVFLIAETGVAPADVVVQRAVNTTLGGIFALLSYVLWPTWERTQIGDVLADMVDRARDYLRSVVQRLESGSDEMESALNASRRAWRQARSAAEASVDRVSSEPGADGNRIALLQSILASSHALMQAFLHLEAYALRSEPQPLTPEALHFLNDVDATLYYVSAALRRSSAAQQILPALRDDYRKMADAQEEQPQDSMGFLLEQADLLTVSLNTLREKVSAYVGQPKDEHLSGAYEHKESGVTG